MLHSPSQLWTQACGVSAEDRNEWTRSPPWRQPHGVFWCGKLYIFLPLSALSLCSLPCFPCLTCVLALFLNYYCSCSYYRGYICTWNYVCQKDECLNLLAKAIHFLSKCLECDAVPPLPSFPLLLHYVRECRWLSHLHSAIFRHMPLNCRRVSFCVFFVPCGLTM